MDETRSRACVRPILLAGRRAVNQIVLTEQLIHHPQGKGVSSARRLDLTTIDPPSPL